MSNFLEETEIINFSHPDTQALALMLSKGCITDEEIAKQCFLFVRDEIQHSGDYKSNITTLIASDVLKHHTGWCYAKSHLLASLLRANKIPTGF
ncbi:MAG: transglutaminase family protein, partial [Arcobacter sp.]|nr:transglutaminase family protein [Arcobacter sp.]